MYYENITKDIRFPFICAISHGNLPFMTHCHQEMELIILQEGCLNVTYEGVPYVLTEGDVWIVPPFGSHSIEYGPEGCVRLVILLELNIMGTWTKLEEEELHLQNQLEERFLFSSGWDAITIGQVTGVIEAMYNEYVQRQDAWQLAIKTKLNELILLILRHIPKCEKQPINTHVVKLKNILEYIAVHYHEEISLEACAAVAGFNPTYLSRYFKQHMEITYQEYIKRLRIDRAKLLLKTELSPVTEIAYQSGFQDIKTFNKLFKRECGMSPSDYRKVVKSE